MSSPNSAARIAAESDAKLVIATGYFPQEEDLRAADVLKDEGYKMCGNAIYAILREARERAEARLTGAPADANYAAPAVMSISWVRRTLLPDGSRKPQSTPYGI